MLLHRWASLTSHLIITPLTSSHISQEHNSFSSTPSAAPPPTTAPSPFYSSIAMGIGGASAVALGGMSNQEATTTTSSATNYPSLPAVAPDSDNYPTSMGVLPPPTTTATAATTTNNSHQFSAPPMDDHDQFSLHNVTSPYPPQPAAAAATSYN